MAQFKQLNGFDYLGVRCPIPGVEFVATAKIDYGVTLPPVDIPISGQSVPAAYSPGVILELGKQSNLVPLKSSLSFEDYLDIIIVALIGIGIIVALVQFLKYKDKKDEERREMNRRIEAAV